MTDSKIREGLDCIGAIEPESVCVLSQNAKDREMPVFSDARTMAILCWRF